MQVSNSSKSEESAAGNPAADFAPSPPGAEAQREIFERIYGAAARRTGLFRRRLADRLTSRVITLGGWLIIGIIILLIAVLFGEVGPLLRRSSSAALAAAETKAQISAFPVEERVRQRTSSFDAVPAVTSITSDGKYLAIIYRNGAAALYSLSGGETKLIHAAILIPDNGSQPDGMNFQAVVPAGDLKFSAISSKGDFVSFSFAIMADSIDGKPVQYVKSKVDPPAPLPVGPAAVRRLAVQTNDRGDAAAAIIGDRELLLIGRPRRRGLIASAGEQETRAIHFAVDCRGVLKAEQFLHDGAQLALGTDSGELIVYDFNKLARPLFSAAAKEGESATEPQKPAAALAPGSLPPITALTALGSARNLIAGDAEGGLTEWALLSADGGLRLEHIRTYSPMAAAISSFSKSDRTRLFASLDAGGDIFLQHSPGGKTLLRIDDTAFATGNTPFGAARNLALSARADRLYFTDYSGKLFSWKLDIPYPDVDFTTLLKQVWYEDYPAPEYVWQSGGGSDLVEPKYSLIPLIFGTLKGTLYALFLSLPLAFAAALYTSQFLDPNLRNWIKPTVELMAAVPSVVVGMIAGLWLAPRVESALAGLLLIPIVLTLTVIAAHLLMRFLPARVVRLLRSERGILALMPLAAAAFFLAFAVGPAIESNFFGGDLRGWLAGRFGLIYDQRNAIVIGIAMGFAVIPLIYTVAEDVLSSVPRSLIAGSLALGATRWETAIRIVLPTASPGLFAAAMLGLGRAVGETMIVLMAAGNTPIMDFSPFNGLRALSANIAVELPEAPVGGSLYRILFLTALLLFALTFAINTISEFIRSRLRRRYQAG